MTARTAPVWRSLLYMPAHVTRFVDRAHERGADAVLLDLEDSVPPSEKAAARVGIAAAAAKAAPAAAGTGLRRRRGCRTRWGWREWRQCGG